MVRLDIIVGFDVRADGSATRPLLRTWADCASSLRARAEAFPDCATRTAAMTVTAHGDGIWLGRRLAAFYAKLFKGYGSARRGLAPTWGVLASLRRNRAAHAA